MADYYKLSFLRDVKEGCEVEEIYLEINGKNSRNQDLY